MEDKRHNRLLTAEEFGRIFKKCRPIYINIANSYIHDMVAAEDIVCDSFVKMWEKRWELETDNFEAYAFKTVINRCLDYLKVTQSRLRIQQEIHSTGNRMQMYEINSLKSLNPDKLFADEVIGLVKECVRRMPDETRKVFIASRIDLKTYTEISEETGLSVRQITTHMQKALKALREQLKDYIPFIAVILLLLQQQPATIQDSTSAESDNPESVNIISTFSE